MDEIEKERLSDSLRYQIEELERAQLKAGEYDSICARRDLLRNAEKLTEALDAASALLSGDEDNALSMTQNAAWYVSRAAAWSPELEQSAEALNSAAFSLSDVAETLRDCTWEQLDELERKLMVCLSSTWRFLGAIGSMTIFGALI